MQLKFTLTIRKATFIPFNKATSSDAARQGHESPRMSPTFLRPRAKMTYSTAGPLIVLIYRLWQLSSELVLI